MPDNAEREREHPILRGISLPARARGRKTKDDREAWLACVDELMARGISNPNQLRNVTGLPYSTATPYLEECRKRAVMHLDTVGELATRRELLYREADAVAAEAFRRSFDEQNASCRVGYMRIVLEANKRKSALLGLDSVALNINTKTELRAMVDVVANVQAEYGIAPAALAAIGRDAAKALTTAVRDADVLDVEVVSNEAASDATRKGEGAPPADPATEAARPK